MYKLTNTNLVIRLSDGVAIPFDEGNTDYQEYFKWLADGNEPEPADAVPTPEVSVSRFQARAALHLSGILTTVEALMSAPETDMLAKLAWQDAQEFRRNSPTVLAMAGALGLTDEQLDQLFEVAKSIEA